MLGGRLDRQAINGDGREMPHIAAGSLPGAGSKQLTLGLGGGAAAGPQGQMRPEGLVSNYGQAKTSRTRALPFSSSSSEPKEAII